MAFCSLNYFKAIRNAVFCRGCCPPGEFVMGILMFVIFIKDLGDVRWCEDSSFLSESSKCTKREDTASLGRKSVKIYTAPLWFLFWKPLMLRHSPRKKKNKKGHFQGVVYATLNKCVGFSMPISPQQMTRHLIFWCMNSWLKWIEAQVRLWDNLPQMAITKSFICIIEILLFLSLDDNSWGPKWWVFSSDVWQSYVCLFLFQLHISQK